MEESKDQKAVPQNSISAQQSKTNFILLILNLMEVEYLEVVLQEP